MDWSGSVIFQQLGFFLLSFCAGGVNSAIVYHFSVPSMRYLSVYFAASLWKTGICHKTLGGSLVDADPYAGTYHDAPPFAGGCTASDPDAPQCSNCMDDDGDMRVDGAD